MTKKKLLNLIDVNQIVIPEDQSWMNPIQSSNGDWNKEDFEELLKKLYEHRQSSSDDLKKIKKWTLCISSNKNKTLSNHILDLLESLPNDPKYDGVYWYDIPSRDFFTWFYAWSIPSRSAIQEIKEFSQGESILEIGAGLALWAFLLQCNDVDIHPTSIYDAYHQQNFIYPWTSVEILSAEEALKKYKEYPIVMLNWGKRILSNVLPWIEKNKSIQKLIIIGEPGDGCNDSIDYENKYFTLEKTVDIPRWSGIHDYIFFYQRIK